MNEVTRGNQQSCSSRSCNPEGSNPEGRDSRGVNLVELLVAMSLLAATLLAVLGTLALARQGIKSGMTLTQATSLAESVLAEISVTGGWEFVTTNQASANEQSLVVAERYYSGGSETTSVAFTASDNANYYERLNGFRQDFLDLNLPLPRPGETERSQLLIYATPIGSTSGNFNVPGLMKMAVEVKWSDRGLRHRSVRVESIAQISE